jgi:hypothetical protein
LTAKSYKATLTVAVRPGSANDEFIVYFRAFEKRRGKVIVTLLPDVMRDAMKTEPRAVAELAALNYLLMTKEVLSQGRTGEDVLITVSCRAMKELRLIEKLPPIPRKKLLDEGRSKKYIPGTKLPLALYQLLKRHASGFLTRFGSSDLAVDGDARWIDPVVPEAQIFTIEVDGPVAGTTEMTGVGRVAVSAHAFERFRARGNNAEPAVVWKAMMAELRDPELIPVDFPPEVMEQKIEKYREVGQMYLNPRSGWRFHVAEGPEGPVVVTAFVRI